MLLVTWHLHLLRSPRVLWSEPRHCLLCAASVLGITSQCTGQGRTLAASVPNFGSQHARQGRTLTASMLGRAELWQPACCSFSTHVCICVGLPSMLTYTCWMFRSVLKDEDIPLPSKPISSKWYVCVVLQM